MSLMCGPLYKTAAKLTSTLNEKQGINNASCTQVLLVFKFGLKAAAFSFSHSHTLIVGDDRTSAENVTLLV